MVNTLEGTFRRLGLNKNNGLHRFGEELPDYPSRIKISLRFIDYDAIYSIGNRPKILFKEFPLAEDIEDRISDLHIQVWNLGEVPILYIVLPNEIRIYDGFIFEKDREKNRAWKTFSSEKDDELEEFSFMNLVSGALWKRYERKFNRKTRVQDYLLKNLRDARELLYEKGLSFPIIHNIIGRLVFSRYLIDRKVLDGNFFNERYGCNFEEIILKKEELYDFFEYLKTTFDGDMFPFIQNEKEIVSGKHLMVLYMLLKGDEIKTGQTVLFDIYDFSIIPVELISNIYETFLKKEDMDSNKSYYTPLFLVDYILDQTLDKLLEKRSNSNCKVLDPACGSGVFLVESLRRIIEKEKEIKGEEFGNEDLERIVLNNIFGIDKDEDAMNLSIFSIYLTLLDYQEPKDIEKFRFPELINRNLFVSDFFDLSSAFNHQITNIDLIVGNPPWGSVDGPHLRYCRDNDIPVSDKQIAQSFLFRAKDFIKVKSHLDESVSRIALIVTSKILYNIKAEEFRKKFLKTFTIDRILEFSPIRRKVFKNAIGPGAAIFYQLADIGDTGNSIIEHVSLKPNRFFDLFHTIVIEKTDVKHIQKKYFIEYPWLWKAIVYGSVLDFHFIRRLKNEYKTILDVILEADLKKGVGLKPHGRPENTDASELKGIVYLDNPKKMLQRYSVNIGNAQTWEMELVHRNPGIDLFTPSLVLIKKGLNADFQAVSAFSDQEMVFRDSITAIKGTPSDSSILKNIVGLLNSRLFTYYIMQTGSSTGIEREQVHNREKFSFPAVLDDRIVKKVDQLHSYKSANRGKSISREYRETIIELENELDETIYELYEVDSIERDLIDYVTDISIPLFKGKKEPFDRPTNSQLIDYAHVFTDYFAPRLNGPDDFFCVDIYHNVDYFVAMNFKVISQEPQKIINFIRDADTSRIIRALGRVSIEKKRDSLYFQRDIKGFETASFYIIKPNEYKNWHRAIARLDLSEFIEAMMRRDLRRTRILRIDTVE